MGVATSGKQVLIVQGGWDGHEPALTSKRFAAMLEQSGYTCRISPSLDVLADAEGLLELDLIVACWTMGGSKTTMWSTYLRRWGPAWAWPAVTAACATASGRMWSGSL